MAMDKEKLVEIPGRVDKEPNICATCLQDCKFDTIDAEKCNAYINTNDNKI